MHKKLLLLLLFIVPFAGKAQIIEAGINGGTSANTKPDINTNVSPPACRECKSLWSATASARVVANMTNHFQLGLGIDYQKIRNRAYNLGPGGARREITAVYADPVMPIYLIGNYRHGYGATYFYAGGSLGYAISYSRRTNPYAWDVTNPTNYIGNGNGVVAGIQVGASKRLSPRFALQLEAAMKFYSLKVKSQSIYPKNYTIKTFVFPLTLGLRYRFYNPTMPLIEEY